MPFAEQELLTFGAPEFTPYFKWGSCYSILSFMCMFCRSLSFCTFSFCHYVVWPSSTHCVVWPSSTHCVVWPSSTYGFWLLFCYLQTLLELDVNEVLLLILKFNFYFIYLKQHQFSTSHKTFDILFAIVYQDRLYL